MAPVFGGSKRGTSLAAVDFASSYAFRTTSRRSPVRPVCASARGGRTSLLWLGGAHEYAQTAAERSRMKPWSTRYLGEVPFSV